MIFLKTLFLLSVKFRRRSSRSFFVSVIRLPDRLVVPWRQQVGLFIGVRKDVLSAKCSQRIFSAMNPYLMRQLAHNITTNKKSSHIWSLKMRYSRCVNSGSSELVTIKGNN